MLLVCYRISYLNEKGQGGCFTFVPPAWKAPTQVVVHNRRRLRRPLHECRPQLRSLDCEEATHCPSMHRLAATFLLPKQPVIFVNAGRRGGMIE